MGEPRVAGVVIVDGVGEAEDDADGDAGESEAADAFGPAAGGIIDDGHGTHEEVDGAVDEGHVEGGEEDDGLEEEEDPGAEESVGKDFGGELFALALFEDANVGFIRVVFREGYCFAGEEDGAVGFRDKDGAEDAYVLLVLGPLCPRGHRKGKIITYHPNKYTTYPLHPPPPHILCHEPAHHRPEDRPQKRRHAIQRHRQPSLRGREEIRDCATRVDERRAAEGAGKESQYHKGCNVPASRGAAEKGDHSDMGGEPEDLAPVELRPRGLVWG